MNLRDYILEKANGMTPEVAKMSGVAGVLSLQSKAAALQEHASALIANNQQAKNRLNDKIDSMIAQVHEMEREIAALDEQSKWANEVFYALKDVNNDGRTD